MSTSFPLMVRYCGMQRWQNCEADLANAAMSATEKCELKRLTDPIRRRQWLVGRCVAKELLAAALRLSPRDVQHEIEIAGRNAQGLGVRPEIRRRGELLPWSLSISHSERGVLVALAPSGTASVGVDLASAAPRGAGFRSLWFTTREQTWLQQQTDHRTAELWALKESFYKACNQGEPWTPQSIEVAPRDSDRFDCTFFGRNITAISAAVRPIDRQIAAVVCVSPCNTAV